MSMSSPAGVLAQAERAVARYGRVALAQIVRAEGSTPGKSGWKLLVLPDGSVEGNLGGGAFEAMVAADARAKLAEARPAGEVKRYYLTEEAVKGTPTGMVCGGMAEVFLEVLAAPPLAVVLGGGPVGQALAAAAGLAGFEVLVADDRAEFRRPELFPAGTRLAEVDRAFATPYLEPVAGRELYAAVVTRCWETDVAALASVLDQAPERLAYLGLMGSRRKVERVRREVEARGLSLTDIPFHAPIGLPVGGDTPGEIAIGITAEMLQVRHAVD